MLLIRNPAKACPKGEAEPKDLNLSKLEISRSYDYGFPILIEQFTIDGNL